MNHPMLSQIDELKSLLYQRQQFLESANDVPKELQEKINSFLFIDADKIDSLCAFVSQTHSQSEWLESEIEALKKEKKKLDDAVDFIHELAKASMLENGIIKMEGKRGHSISLRQSESVKVESLDVLSDRYKRQKISIEPDKQMIKAAIKGGENVQGATLEKSTYVVIK